jgi:cytochrome bd-type quinol oxidase subunit 2
MMLSNLLPLLADASSTVTDAAKKTCGTGVNSACNNNSLAVVFHNVANALIFLVGAVAVIMIIIGGLRYILANGDSKSAADARNTILYSVIGVIVALISFAIVNFVATAIK